MTTLIGNAKNIYAAHLAEEFGPPNGSSEESIAACEEAFGYTFPKALREYLLWMGNDTDGVFRGSEWFCNDIISNTKNLPYLLQDNNVIFEHPGKPLCFFSHQGYMKAWFYLPCEEDDPQCYFYSEGGPAPHVKSVGKFSDFLVQELMGPVRRRLSR